MKKRAVIAPFIFLCLHYACAEVPQERGPEGAFTLSEVAAHIRFLASDELQGRKPGTWGADVAARYIAEQFRSVGLRTFSGAPDYFQEAELVFNKKAENKTAKENKKPVFSKNVIGYIEGKDPGKRNEFVLLCAHYDHLGMRDSSGSGDEDVIYNGARDNAMGTAALIYAAKTLALEPPARSIIFIAFTGEEEGCLGSKYYTSHPLIPLENIVFVLNNDGGGFNDTKCVRIAGLEWIASAEIISQAAERFGLSALPYPKEYRYLFKRSDNMPFVDKGIPGITVSPGFDQIDEEILRYVHTVEDEADDSFDYAYLLRFSKAYAAVATALANAAEIPGWIREG